MHEPFDHEELLSNRRRRPVETEPTPETKPEINFSWPRFILFSLLMVIAWVLGQFTPWFPDEIAAEIILFGIYAYYNTLGFRRRK